MNSNTDQKHTTGHIIAPLRTGGLNLPSLQAWSNSIPTSRRGLALCACAVLISVVGIGGTWAATAKLGGALIGSGRVFAEGNNRIVQHLEGGVVEQIMAREGDEVKAGQTLIKLEETSSRSQLDRVLVEKAVSTIELTRWRAERDGAASFAVDPSLLDPVSKHPRVVEALESQMGEFTSSRESRQQQLLVLDGKIANEREDITYLESLLSAYGEQKVLLQKEEKSYVELLDQGLIRQSQVFAAQRTLAQLEAQRANALAGIQKSNHNIKSFGDQKLGLISQHAELVSKSITETQQKLNQNEDYITRLTDTINRSRVKSPVDGVILSLLVKSTGGVIKSGDKIAEILPKSSDLLLQVPIYSKDITKIYTGQDVEVVFPTDTINAIPPMDGTVSYISADAFTDTQTNSSYYIAHVKMSDARHGRNVLPGNVAEVFFRTEAKTLFEYISEPVTRFAMKTYTE